MERIPVPFPKQYVIGLDFQKAASKSGIQLAYLRGVLREDGWWYYYLYAIMVKRDSINILDTCYPFSRSPSFGRVNALYGYPRSCPDGNGSTVFIPRDGLSYFQEFEPLVMIGGSMMLYEISKEDIRKSKTWITYESTTSSHSSGTDLQLQPHIIAPLEQP